MFLLISFIVNEYCYLRSIFCEILRDSCVRGAERVKDKLCDWFTLVPLCKQAKQYQKVFSTKNAEYEHSSWTLCYRDGRSRLIRNMEARFAELDRELESRFRTEIFAEK